MFCSRQKHKTEGNIVEGRQRQYLTYFLFLVLETGMTLEVQIIT